MSVRSTFLSISLLIIWLDVHYLYDTVPFGRTSWFQVKYTDRRRESLAPDYVLWLRCIRLYGIGLYCTVVFVAHSTIQTCKCDCTVELSIYEISLLSLNLKGFVFAKIPISRSIVKIIVEKISSIDFLYCIAFQCTALKSKCVATVLMHYNVIISEANSMVKI